jgi:hypothetical protein
MLKSRVLPVAVYRAFMLALLAIIVFWSGVSCRNDWEDFDTSSNVHLSFSADTVSFDTVFTTMQTVTKWVMVRNTGDKRIKISRIYLKEGVQSAFRLNVDGDTSLNVNNIVVAGRDSFYIFITANISYLKNVFSEVNDNIVFEINGKKQHLALQAWGQNAYYHFPDKTDKRVIAEGDTQVIRYFEFPAGTVLPNDKPHVFFGYAASSVGGGLVIPAGTQCYFANEAGLWIRGSSSIEIQGTYTNPVLFTSLRQDYDYKTMAGQWEGLLIDAESVDNKIRYATIRNAKYGIYVDSSNTTGVERYALEIYNTRIENMTRSGILSRKNYIKGVNLVVGNCATALSLMQGGGALFFYCTFTNYYKSFEGKYTLVLNDYVGEQSCPFTSVEFINCIIFGKDSEQIYFDLKAGETSGVSSELPYLFDHCVTGTPVNNDRFISCLNSDPLFKGENEGNFEISSDKSPVVKAGNSTYSDPDPLSLRDINNVPRDTPPTIGAYEFVKPTNP